MRSIGSSDELCSLAAKAYTEATFSGASSKAAAAAATEAYIKEYNLGSRVTRGSPCESAEQAFRDNFFIDGNAVQEATLAFVSAWPGLSAGNPCAVAGKAYLDAVAEGKNGADAQIASADAYLDALTASPDALEEDSACAAAAEAFIDSV